MPADSSKLDFEYYEGVILLNALLNQEYLASIVEHLDPMFFNDKNIGTIFKSIASFFNERGVVPSLTEIKARLTSDIEKKAFNEVSAKLKQLDSKFNKDELVHNTEKFLKEKSLLKAINDAVEKYTTDKIDIQDTLAQFEKVHNITLIEDLGHWYSPHRFCLDELKLFKQMTTVCAEAHMV